MVWCCSSSSWPVLLLCLAVLCVTDQGIQAIGTPLPQISFINLRNCSELTRKTNKTGAFDNWLDNGLNRWNVKTYCEVEEDGTTWTVIQRRANIKRHRGGRTNFYRTFDDYKYGFGNVKREFWWGLENIWQLTSGKKYILRIELVSCDRTAYAEYQVFSISSELNGYKLNVANYKGTAGDSLSLQNGAKFSTYDNDQDRDPNRNCAFRYKSGWWWYECGFTSLNGRYVEDCPFAPDGIWWMKFTRLNSLKMTEMKIRPAN